MAPRTSESAATAALTPSALPQSPKTDSTASQSKGTATGTITEPIQNTDPIAHEQHIYDTILSYYDWSTLPAAPAEKSFKPFFLFCSQDLYSKRPEFGKLVASMKRCSATRLIAGEQREIGYAWDFQDASSAAKVAAGVDMQNPKMILGWDLVAIEGELKACRVPFVV